jgi:hypothetical protein
MPSAFNIKAWGYALNSANTYDFVLLIALFWLKMGCFIQSVPGGKFNILGDHSIGHSKKKVYMNM